MARREYLARCVGDGGGALGCAPSMAVLVLLVLLLPSSLPLLPKKKEDDEDEDAATDRGEDCRLRL